MPSQNSPQETAEPEGLGGAKPRVWGYWCLLALQTVGAILIIGNGVPIYRQMAADFSKHRPQPGILWWGVAAVALIQTAYWLRHCRQPALPRARCVLAGHLVQFLARLAFILPSSSFTVMILVRFEQLNLSAPRLGMLVALMFSMFCYSLELERLARVLQEAPKS